MYLEKREIEYSMSLVKQNQIYKAEKVSFH